LLQIVWNWMLVAVFPLLAGLLFRWLLRRWRRGSVLTADNILGSGKVVQPIAHNDRHTQAVVGLRAIQAACLTLGAGVVELVLKLKRRL